MLVLVILLTMLSTYMVAGAKYARGRYAVLMNQAEQTQADASLRASKENKLRELEKIHPFRDKRYHNPKCSQHNYNHIAACNCGSMDKIYKEQADLREYLGGTIPEPEVFKPMVFWPLYVMSSYLKSGTINKYNPALTAKLERELGIGENK